MKASPSDLRALAQALVSGRGILAADESQGTIQRRFDSIQVESTPSSRCAYREMLFRTEGLGKHCSGVILFDETIRQQAEDGTPLRTILESGRIVPGIKVDKGMHPLAGSPDEKVAEGLDGLRERLVEYRELGARFAKWRATISVGEGLPTDYAIAVNAHALARYAALCVDEGILPIVEPEVLMDGTHTIDAHYEATARTLKRVFAALDAQRVPFDQLLLKPNMVLSGKSSPDQAAPEEVADRTVRCFEESVPAAVPGVVFLSGGQSPVTATVNLNAMNARHPNAPWALSFSYGRALQEPALKAWGGRSENAPAAQQALLHRAECNAAALSGTYHPDMERA